LLSLDHGLAYFTGKPGVNDSLSLAVPGAQAILTHGARLRLEAQGEWSRISVLEGSARFSSPAAEIELPQGLYAQVEPANRERFFLERKIPALDLDHWSGGRDRLMASTSAQQHVLAKYGLADLDAAGTWIDTGPVSYTHLVMPSRNDAPTITVLPATMGVDCRPISPVTRSGRMV